LGTISAVFVASPSSAQIPVRSIVADYPRDGVELGYGWFSTSGTKALNPCIAFATHSDSAQTKNAEIKSVSDKASFMQQLEVSAEMQVKAVVASASVKTSFANSVDFQSESSTFAARAVVQNGAESVVPPAGSTIHLVPPFDRLARSNPAEFFRRCGDSFVATRYGGAELWGLITFNHVSTEESEQLKVSVEGSGWGVFSGSGSTSSEMKRASDSMSLTIQYAESGGVGDKIPTNQAGLIAAVESLPGLAHDAAQYTQIELVRYEALNDWPGASRSVLHTDVQKIASRFQQLMTLRDEIARIKQKPTDYILGAGVTLDSLQTLDQQLFEHTKRLHDAAQLCVTSNFATCRIDPKDDITDYGFRAQLPVPKFSFHEDIVLANYLAYLPVVRSALAQPGHTPQFYASGREGLASTIQGINHAQAEYPAALKRAIALKWISSPLHDRCDLDAGSQDCIAPKDETAFINQIKISYTPVRVQ